MNLDIEKLKFCLLKVQSMQATLAGMLFFSHKLNKKIAPLYFENMHVTGSFYIPLDNNYPYLGYNPSEDCITRFPKLPFGYVVFENLKDLMRYCMVKPIVEKIYNNDFKLKINLENRTFSIGGCSYPMEILNNLNELNKEAEKLL